MLQTLYLIVQTLYLIVQTLYLIVQTLYLIVQTLYLIVQTLYLFVYLTAQMFDKRAPEFLTPLPITKTRAGMQVRFHTDTVQC
jgi:hypothetical protein